MGVFLFLRRGGGEEAEAEAGGEEAEAEAEEEGETDRLRFLEHLLSGEGSLRDGSCSPLRPGTGDNGLGGEGKGKGAGGSKGAGDSCWVGAGSDSKAAVIISRDGVETWGDFPWARARVPRPGLWCEDIAASGSL